MTDNSITLTSNPILSGGGARKNADPAEREIWIDALKIAACFGVILCHSVYSYSDTENPGKWFLALAINSFARFGVPCFMMVSAVLIFQKQDSVKKIICRRLPKLVAALVFWGIVYTLRKIWNGENLSLAKEVLTIPFAHKSSHLWYNYYLIALYLISPVFVMFIKHSSKAQQLLIILVFSIGKSFLGMILSLTNAPVSTFVVTGWNKFGIMEFVFAIVAVYVCDSCKNGKIKRFQSILGLLIGYALIVFGSYRLFVLTSKPPQDFFQHMSFPAMLFGVSVFALFYSFKEYFNNLNEKNKSTIVIISKLTMGIYFIHPLVQELILKVFNSVFQNRFSPGYQIIASRPLLSLPFILGIFAVSLAICYIWSKIPLLDKLVV
jgi:surface polysaccharide O-acyltransferase-like enzyme